MSQMAAAGHGVAGVHAEIHQHLIQHARVGMEEQRLRREFELHLDGFTEHALQHFGRGGDGFIQIQIARAGTLRGG